MEDCIFCKIARGEIPARLAYEDDQVVAFHDVNPVAPVHVLIIPREHISGVLAVTEQNVSVVARVWEIIPKLANELSVADPGFRVVVNSGEGAGQSVPHLHFHVLGGRLLRWPPG